MIYEEDLGSWTVKPVRRETTNVHDIFRDLFDVNICYKFDTVKEKVKQGLSWEEMGMKYAVQPTKGYINRGRKRERREINR